MRDDTDWMTGRRPTLVVADDHRMVGEAIAEFVAKGFDLVATAATGEALVSAVIASRPDLVLADINMPDIDGVEALRRIRASGVDSPFVFMTVHSEPMMVREALAAGARGYVLKSAAGAELLRALRTVLDGGVHVDASLLPPIVDPEAIPKITERQLMVLELIADGLRATEIAGKLGMSVRTVETHRYVMMKTVGVRTSLALVREAQRLGILVRR